MTLKLLENMTRRILLFCALLAFIVVGVSSRITMLKCLLINNFINTSLSKLLVSFDNVHQIEDMIDTYYLEKITLKAPEQCYKNAVRNVGNYYRLTKDYTKAEATLIQLLNQNPSDTLLLNDTGSLLFELGRVEKSLQYWSSIGSFNNLISASEYLETIGNIPEAMKYLKGAILVRPSYSVGYRELGRLSYVNGNMVLARDYLIKAISIDSHDLVSYLYLVQVYRQTDQISEAMQLLIGANRLFTDDSRYYEALGDTYYAMGEWNKAQTAYQRAIDLEPENAAYHAHLGIAFLQMNELYFARLELEQAIAGNSQIYWFHSHLGEVYYELGLRELAILEFNLALSLNANDTWAAQRLLEIRGGE